MTRKKAKKNFAPSAESITTAMTANMAANMADHDFELNHEHRITEAAKKALEKHTKELTDAGIKDTQRESL